jgi:hypothetical protein
LLDAFRQLQSISRTTAFAFSFSAEREERTLSEPRRNAAPAISGSQQSEEAVIGFDGFMCIFFSFASFLLRNQKKNLRNSTIFLRKKIFVLWSKYLFIAP